MIKRNWKNILAWGSLCLNIVLIGIIVIGPHRLMPKPPGPPPPQKVLKHIGKDLTGKDRVIFDLLLEKHSAGFKNHRHDMDRAFKGIQNSVLQEPFDIEKVRQAHKKLSSNRAKIDHTIESFILEMVMEISPEGRKKLHLGPPRRPGPGPKN